MRVSAGFRDFVLDQLDGVEGVRGRAMFGGVGLYADEAFFGILAADVLFFKVDDTNRREYEAAGSRPFSPYPGRTVTMSSISYYEVPLAVLEDAATLCQWAARSVAVARCTNPGKPRKRARAQKQNINGVGRNFAIENSSRPPLDRINRRHFCCRITGSCLSFSTTCRLSTGRSPEPASPS